MNKPAEPEEEFCDIYHHYHENYLGNCRHYEPDEDDLYDSWRERQEELEAGEATPERETTA